LDGLLAVIDAGVTRCGATATATILDDFEKRSKEDVSVAGDAKLGNENLHLLRS
jgi:hypothetical protein